MPAGVRAAAHGFRPAVFTLHAKRRWVERFFDRGHIAEAFDRATEFERYPDGVVCLADEATGAAFVVRPHANKAGWAVITALSLTELIACKGWG